MGSRADRAIQIAEEMLREAARNQEVIERLDLWFEEQSFPKDERDDFMAEVLRRLDGETGEKK